jgi:CDP-diacylglycerol--glycerol-3-phosphate 3-phosphatidyltransferase
MGLYAVKPAFQRGLGGIERALVRRRVHPDVLTVGAVLVSALGGLGLWGANWAPWLLLVVPAAAMVRIALNALDGLVARDLGVARPWGEVLNEICDRLSDVALFAGASLAPGSDARLGAAVLVVMLLSSYLGTAAKAAGGRRQYGGVMAKADRMLVLGGAAVLAFFLPGLPVMSVALGVVLAGLAVTLVQRARSTYHDLHDSQPAR